MVDMPFIQFYHPMLVYTHFYRFVVLIIDEMKVWEDLVYDKTGESLHGFVNLGDVNNQLQELEKQTNTGKPHDSFATQMLTVMVRGIFLKLEFPYASFPTQGTLCLLVCACLYIDECMWRGCLHNFTVCDNYDILYTCSSVVKESQARCYTGLCGKLCVVLDYVGSCA